MFKWLTKWFGQSHSLVLLRDPITVEDVDNLESEILEVKKYYDLSALEPIANDLASGINPAGRAVFAIQHPRKSLFQFVLPMLRGQNIPFTLFIDAERVGLTLLPFEDEVQLFSEAFAQDISRSEANELRLMYWKDASKALTKLAEWRQFFQPPPVDQADPLKFFATWGKINDIPPEKLELGWSLSGAMGIDQHRESLEFLNRQLGKKARVMFSLQHPSIDESTLRSWGIFGGLSSEKGLVKTGSSAYAIPVWEEKNAD